MIATMDIQYGIPVEACTPSTTIIASSGGEEKAKLKAAGAASATACPGVFHVEVQGRIELKKYLIKIETVSASRMKALLTPLSALGDERCGQKTNK